MVPLDALEPFRTAGPLQESPVLPYLQCHGPHSFDIQLEVAIQPENAAEQTVCRSNFKHLYWNIAQQLAHQLELTEGGRKPIVFADGTERKFLEDNDTVIMRGFCEKNGLRIGFGEVRGKVLPAL